MARRHCYRGEEEGVRKPVKEAGTKAQDGTAVKAHSPIRPPRRYPLLGCQAGLRTRERLSRPANGLPAPFARSDVSIAFNSLTVAGAVPGLSAHVALAPDSRFTRQPSAVGFGHLTTVQA
jgi:hypothetical protein